MLAWYDLRLIDLYPDDSKWPTHPTRPPGVIGEPREELADEACLQRCHSVCEEASQITPQPDKGEEDEVMSHRTNFSKKVCP